MPTDKVAKNLGHAWLAGYSPQVDFRRGKRTGPVNVAPCLYSATVDYGDAHLDAWRRVIRNRKPRLQRIVAQLMPHDPAGWES